MRLPFHDIPQISWRAWKTSVNQVALAWFRKKTLILAFSAVLLVLAVSYGYKMYLFRLGLDYVQTRDTPKLKSLVSNRHDVATLLLGTAFVNQDKELFEILLDAGADPKDSWINTKWGKEPILLQIAGHEDSFWIDGALKNGVDPNWRLRNVPLLTIAIDSHRPTNARLLMDYGADVNSRFDNQSQIVPVNKCQAPIIFLATIVLMAATSPNAVGGGRMEPSATFGRGLHFFLVRGRSRTPSRSLLRSLRPPPALLGEMAHAGRITGVTNGTLVGARLLCLSCDDRSHGCHLSQRSLGEVEWSLQRHSGGGCTSSWFEAEAAPPPGACCARSDLPQLCWERWHMLAESLVLQAIQTTTVIQPKTGGYYDQNSDRITQRNREGQAITFTVAGTSHCKPDRLCQ